MVPRFSILPADQGFFDWFEKGAANLVLTARLFDAMLRDFVDVGTKVARITEQEHHGDFIVHEINDMLHRRSKAPFDRQTVRELAGALDDVVDDIEAAADLMLLYEVDRPTPQAIRVGQIITACAEQINAAMPLLRDRATRADVRDHTIEINRLENEADSVTRAGVAVLLERRDDLINLFRWKEIYDMLEEATDRCEDVADTLSGIVLATR